MGPKPPGESQLTTKGLTATAVYYQNLDILRQAAALLEKKEDADKWAGLASQVRAAFNAKFLNSARYDLGSQTAQAMPWVLGLVEPDRARSILDTLVQDVRSQGFQVTAGDVGFRFLVEALRMGGRSDVLYGILTRLDGPGYADQLRKGATTLTEAWDANPASSQNHCMLGHAEEWFYTGLAGINPNPTGPGFKKSIIRPQLVGDVTSAAASYDSTYGRIASAWKRDADQLTLDVTIPANATATVYVPARDATKVTESGRPLSEAEGVRILGWENGTAMLSIGSGRYRFESRLP